MRFVFITVNYAPEDTAIGLYTTQLAEYLVSIGHEVEVITGFPYYPQWRIYDEYSSKPRYFREIINGVIIYRYKFYVPSKQSFFRRVLHMLSFFSGNLLNVFKIKKADVIFSNIPFTLNVCLGWIIKKRTGAILWTSIQDFEFDAAFDSGLIKSNLLGRILRRLLLSGERFLLNRCDVVSSISHQMVNKLRKKVKKPFVYYLPNWIDEWEVDFEQFRDKHPLVNPKKFTVLYSGNIGNKQDWEIYIELVKEFKFNDSIEFLLVGDGACRKELISRLKEIGCLNSLVRFHPPVKYKELPHLLQSVQLHILFQKTDVVDSVMPSKILGMMRSGVPSIITGNAESEVAKHVLQSQKWGFINHNDVQLIKEHILKIIDNPEFGQKIGKLAQNYVLTNFSKKDIFKKFLIEIEMKVNNGKSKI